MPFVGGEREREGEKRGEIQDIKNRDVRKGKKKKGKGKWTE